MRWLLGVLLLVTLVTSVEAAKKGKSSRGKSWVPPEILQGRHKKRDRTLQGTQLQGGALEGSVVRGAIDSSPDYRLASAEMDGFSFGEKPFTVKVKAELPDPCPPAGGGIKLYQIEMGGVNPCEGVTLAGAGLSQCQQEHIEVYRGKAIAVTGGWGERLQYVASTPERPFSTFSCLSGVIAKCTQLDYRLWAGPEYANLLQTCLRMLRGDYCGTGIPHTCDGTSINLADQQGIQKRDVSDAAATAREVFEADWSPDGAVCLEAPRLPGCTDAQRQRLVQIIREECEAHRHPIQIGNCTASCAAGGETCGHMMRTWTELGQTNTCEASEEYCPASR